MFKNNIVVLIATSLFFSASSYSIAMSPAPLDALKDIIETQLHKSLQSEYDNGRKYLLGFSLSLEPPEGPKASAGLTVYIDLADYFRITNEGKGDIDDLPQITVPLLKLVFQNKFCSS